MLEVFLSRHLVWRVIAVLAVVGAAAYLVSTRPIRLGLDLEGGTQIVLQAQDTQSQQVVDVAADGEGRNARESSGEIVLPDEEGNRLRLEEAALTGDAVGNARAEPDAQLGLAWQVTISWRGNGGDTGAHNHRRPARRAAGHPPPRLAGVL